MSDQVTEVTSESWFSRIGGAIKGVVTGIVLCAGFLFGAWGVFAVEVSQDPDGLAFEWSAQKDQVQLRWQTATWPKGAKGFLVKRRAIGATEWQALGNGKVVVPGVDANRDWAAQGLTEAQATKLKGTLQKRLTDKTVTPVLPAEFLAHMKQEGMPMGARIMLRQDPELALILGFCAIDNAAGEGKGAIEYGLFVVAEDGTVNAKNEPFGNTQAGQYNAVRKAAVRDKADAAAAGLQVKADWHRRDSRSH